jgi:hypothetical protein
MGLHDGWLHGYQNKTVFIFYSQIELKRSYLAVSEMKQMEGAGDVK